MNMFDIIKTRKSFRTFDGRPLTEEDKQALEDYANQITNPYGIPVEFLFLDAKEYGLSSNVIYGEQLYVAGKVKKVPHCEEAFGYALEKLVLYAWSRGIGTTWIGGTMNRKLFEEAAETKEDEFMPCVSPLGYPSEDAARSEVDVRLRNAVHGDERLAPGELFFEDTYGNPINMDAYNDALEAVRWYPSAANMQPCRIVRMGNEYHFYEKHKEGYKASAPWDVQAVDMGIALCHFISMVDGEFLIKDPGIETEADTDYIATVRVK